MLEGAVIAIVFAITGSAALILSRPILENVFGVRGTLFGGPWSYRVAYLLTIPPTYSVTLVIVGTVFGRHHFFANKVRTMWSRLLAPMKRGVVGPKRD